MPPASSWRSLPWRGSPQEQADRAILRGIPGIGVILSEVILADLPDLRRFSSAKQVVA